MINLYMVICKQSIFVYEKTNSGYNSIFIEGNAGFQYELHSVNWDMKKLLDYLVDEFNLDDESEVFFNIIENEDKVINKVFKNILNGHINKVYSLDVLLSRMMQELKGKSLMIEEFGINYDGINYIQTDDVIQKRDFSLLGYTVSIDRVINLI